MHPTFSPRPRFKTFLYLYVFEHFYTCTMLLFRLSGFADIQNEDPVQGSEICTRCCTNDANTQRLKLQATSTATNVCGCVGRKRV